MRQTRRGEAERGGDRRCKAGWGEVRRDLVNLLQRRTKNLVVSALSSMRRVIVDRDEDPVSRVGRKQERLPLMY